MTLGALAMGVFGFGYLLDNVLARHVETAAEARERRQQLADEKLFKRFCKRHRALMQTVANWNWDVVRDGEWFDISILGGTLHMHGKGRQESLKTESESIKGWIEHWAIEAEEHARHPRKTGWTCGVGRTRRGKYVPSGCPVRYGSSKRGKRERPWANIMTPEQMIPGMFLHTTTGPELERYANLTCFDPEVVGAVDTKTVHELFKSEIEPIVLKPEEK